MATDHILSLLVEEREKLNRAIKALAGTAHRNDAKKHPAPAKRRGMSAATRKALSKRMKAYWARKQRAHAE